MLKKWVVLFFTTLFVLAACHSPVYNQTQGNVADAKIKAAAARKKSDNDAKPQSPLIVKQGMYVDMTPINLEREPTWLKSHIVIRGDQLPFSYYSRTIANGTTSNVLTKYQTGLDPAINVTLNYSGTVKGALDLLASKSGYVYSVHNNLVYWKAYVTRTYDIAFMPGGTEYLMGKSSSGASSAATGGGAGGTVSNYTTSDSSDSEYSNLKGTLSIWSDLDSTIKQLLSPEGKVMVSQATTSVTVRDRPTNVDLIGQYIVNLNRSLSKQVLVKVQVIEVNLENDYDFGINWGLIANAFNKSPFVINGNYGTPISISAFTAQPTVVSGAAAIAAPQFGFNPAQNPSANKIPSYQVLLNALNQQGKASVVSEPRVVCLNNQVSVVRIVTSQGYLASVQNTTVASGGTAPTSTVTSQLTPGTTITGLTLYILPKIMRDKVYLQVNADLSVLVNIATFTSGGASNAAANTSSIQLPTVTEKHFNQRSAIRSGDTLILSGFRQVSNQANAMQFLTSQALGGKAAQQLNTETIILITPIVLTGSA